VSLLASQKLAPEKWVEALVSMEAADLGEEPFGPLLLLVRAPEDDDTGQFQKQLVACVMKGTTVTGEHPKWPATTQFPTMNMSSREITDADQTELLAELTSAAHCIVPVRPGRGGWATVVGRAPSASVRFSDPSVSAEHAELSIEDGGVRIRDLSSKNGTTLNGRRLLAEEHPWIQPMDRLTFGRIQAFACDPRVLRAVLRQGLRSLI
jgi:hypothetical protein